MPIASSERSGRWLAGILGIGVALRLIRFLHLQSLWYDEVLLALNIVGRKTIDLFGPLAFKQMAPIGYLLLERLCMLALGPSELVLRLPSLLASVLCLWLFARLARLYLMPTAALAAVSMMALAEPLVYYSAELKPYSFDVLVLLGLVLWIRPLQARPPWRWGLYLALGMLAPLLSLDSIFALGALSLGGIWLRWKAHEPIAPMLLLGLGWLAFFGFFYLVFFSGAGRDATLRQYWAEAMPGSFWTIPAWAFRMLPRAFHDTTGLPAWGLLLWLAGLLTLARKRPEALMVALLPLLLAFCAAALHRYPFQGRLVLFLAPGFLLGCAAALESLPSRPWSLWLGVLLLLGPSGDASLENVFHPPPKEEMRQLLDHVQQRLRPGDVLLTNYYSSIPLLYYLDFNRQFDLSPAIRLATDYCHQMPKKCTDKLKLLLPGQRVWFIYTHGWAAAGLSERELIRQELGRRGRKLEGLELEAWCGLDLYQLDAIP